MLAPVQGLLAQLGEAIGFKSWLPRNGRNSVAAVFPLCARQARPLLESVVEVNELRDFCRERGPQWNEDLFHPWNPTR